MFFTSINNLAVFVSALACMVVGFIWYSPMVFQKPWMKYSKLDAKKLKISNKHQLEKYSVSFVSSLIMAYVIALLLNAVLIVNIQEGMMLGTILWIGFVATSMLMDVVFQNQSWKVFLINSGYQLVSILVMSAILTVWI